MDKHEPPSAIHSEGPGASCSNTTALIGKRFVVYRSFVGSEHDQSILVTEALTCHNQNETINGKQQTIQDTLKRTELSTSSFKLNLGIACGGDLSEILPNAIAVARRAFLESVITFSINRATTSKNSTKSIQSIANSQLSGLSLLYGMNASMSPHYDSPTQPNQREEWLCLISLGNTIEFRCNDETVTIHSGDVIVMDSMAVLHGVERVVRDTSQHSTISTRLGLPLTQARLAILFWQGRKEREVASMKVSEVDDNFDGVDALFKDENEELECSS